MQRVPQEIERGLMDDLGHSRVREDTDPDLLGCYIQQPTHRQASDQLCRVWTDDRHAQHIVGLGISNDFGKALSLAFDDRLAIWPHRKLAGLDRSTLANRLFFRQPDTGDFRPAECHHWRVEDVEWVGLVAGDLFDGNDAHVHGCVGEHLRAVNVADGKHVRHIGPHHGVYRNESAGRRHTDLLQPNVFNVPLAADSHDENFGLDDLFFAPVILDPHPHSGLGHVNIIRSWTRSREDGDTLSLEGADQHGRGFFVLGRYHPSDQTHLRAVATIDRRPLHANRSTAANDEALRQRL